MAAGRLSRCSRCYVEQRPALPRLHIPTRLFSRGRRLSEQQYRPSAQHKISVSERKLNVPWEDGKTSSFHHIWLRDHCRSPECFHQITSQRLLETAKIPRDIAPQTFEAEAEGLRIKWSDGGHESFYTWDWLHRHSYSPKLEKSVAEPLQYWGAEIGDAMPTVSYEAVMSSDSGVGEWLSLIHRIGFAIVKDTPPTPEASEKLLERIAFIRLTQ